MNNNSLLCDLQHELADILKKVILICKENNLKYVLVGGTLLGAVRHNGFIPWDDDLDIAMPREDYEKFIKIANRELPSTLYLRCFETDETYYFPYGKVCKKGTAFATDIDQNCKKECEVFIDVFPLDNAYKEKSFFQTLQACGAKGLRAVITRKSGFNIKKTSLPVLFLCLILKPFSTSTLMRLQRTIMKKNRDTKSAYYVNIGSNYSYKKQTMLKSVYFPAITTTFEGEEYMIPRETNYWLERIYGKDYMELPPENKRITHNIIKLSL